MIIIGLGNPGTKFNHTPHNAGFEALDVFARENNLPDFELSKKHEALVSEKDEIVLVKPQTFMNESGRSASGFKFQVSKLVVVHDDTDMQLGKIKFVKDSTSGGHKGVESIIQHLATKDFIRLKIGVKIGEEKALDVVLKKFAPEQQETYQQVIEKSAAALKKLIDDGLEKAMNEFNK